MAVPPSLLIAALAAGLLAAGAPGHARTAGPRCVACHGTHEAARGTCTDCHRGNDRVMRVNVAHAHLLRGAAAAWRIPGSVSVNEGARWRDRLGCRRCHVTGGRGAALAVSLDAVVWHREQDELRRSIQHPVSTMPDFSLSTAQVDRLVAVLLRDGRRAAGSSRYLVRFRRGGPPGPSAFETRCGPCHRALTARGPLGSGATGPNLSGLLGAYYPDPDGRPWDRARLERWLRNPRADRPAATMRPVAVSPAELDEICTLLRPLEPRDVSRATKR